MRKGYIKPGVNPVEKCAYCGKFLTLSPNKRSRLRRGVTKHAFCNGQHHGLWRAKQATAKARLTIPEVPDSVECLICGNKLPLTGSKKWQYIHNGSRTFYCSEKCRNIRYSLGYHTNGSQVLYRKVKAEAQCAKCGREMFLNRQQRWAYIIKSQRNFYCSRECSKSAGMIFLEQQAKAQEGNP